jgi:hypothetical protein
MNAVWKTLAVTGALLLSGCTQIGPEPVRPLIDPGGADTSPLALYDDASVQQRLDQLAEQISELARQHSGWSGLSTDVLNPEIHDVVLISGERSPFSFGGGTESASTDLTDTYAAASMAADNAICWVIRLSGDPTDPKLERSAKFDVECIAARYQGDTVTWSDQWPESPTPGETDQDGLVIGQPRLGDGP